MARDKQTAHSHYNLQKEVLIPVGVYCVLHYTGRVYLSRLIYLHGAVGVDSS